MQDEGKKWVLSDIPPHISIRLKNTFPRIAKHQTNHFSFPNDFVHCFELDWFMQRYPCEISEKHRAILTSGRKKYEVQQDELESILSYNYKAPSYIGLKPNQVVRNYQAQAVEILARRKSLLLGDDLGLGKTYTAAACMLLPGVLPAAVVVQTHLQKQWLEKLTEFTTLRVCLIKTTRPHDLPEADVYIFRYSQLSGWVDVFETEFFKFVVYDEIQELRRGTESAKGAGAKVLTTKTQYQLGLSATPIMNFGLEMWDVMSYVDPYLLGSKAEFYREWINADNMLIDPKAFGTYLRDQHVFLRREKADVGQQMPKVNRIVEYIDSDPHAIQSITDLAKQLAIKVMSGSFVERGQAGRELDMLARQATGVGKARNVAAFVRMLLETGTPIILFGWHREVYSIWLKELSDFNPVMYTGSESATQKKASFDAFVSGSSKLLIMSLRSGAGVDKLQHVCSTVVFGELDWSKRFHDQAIGRVDREGQTQPVTAFFLNSEDGSDPAMVDLSGLKASDTSPITDPDQVFEIIESDTSRIRALAMQFLDKQSLRDIDTQNSVKNLNLQNDLFVA